MNDIDGWDDHILLLESMVEHLQDAALAGAREGAELLEEDASLTRLYDDKSGATRYSTTAYAEGPTDRSASSIIDERASRSQSIYNEALANGIVDGSAFAIVDEIQPAGNPEAISVILTALMDYDENLITMQSGARDFITESMMGNAGRLMDAIVTRLREAHA